MSFLTGASSEPLDRRIAALVEGADIVKPAGNGPFPVVVQLHGCGGKKPHQARWAEVARDAGWAAMVVDSYRHRGITSLQAYTSVCTGMRLWGRERAGDLYAAMHWLRTQAWVDPARIAVAGWSHGGWTVLDAMSLEPGRDMAWATGLTGLDAEPLAGLIGAFVVYPFVGPGSVARSHGLRVDASTLALVGTRDVIVGGRSVGRALERMATPREPVSVVVLEGATHAFDEPETRDMRTRYDPELTARAHTLYRDFLSAASARRSLVGQTEAAPGDERGLRARRSGR
jgi:dienelactone hydrolase